MSEIQFSEKKLVVVGDSKCGKSAVLYMLAKELYLEGYVPTLFENYASEIESNQGLVQVSMYDTPGDDNYSHIRPLSYPDTDILLLCFDLSSPQSYHNIFTKWIPEIREYCPGVPFIIVGCKNDLINMELKKADDYIVSELAPTTQDEMAQLLSHTGAVDYFQCSAKYNYNLIGLFSKAVDSTFHRKRNSSKKYRNRTLSTIQSEPSISHSSSFRRRASTDVSPYKKQRIYRTSYSSCLPTFHRRRPVVNDDIYFRSQSNGNCTIL
ncbi:RAS-like GTP-binding protein [Oopsacas minuta]|uniref:RAS-like GTP-binding protein n=1 Tax=Oopsacas minuta TaxID=111878 RepID=A0AAV7JLG6_9METZ|nr:RAS-like GTP-binding protein [Oopsacas minuta]